MMNRFGTRLGLFLYWTLLVVALLLLIGLLVGVLVTALGLFSPESLADPAAVRDGIDMTAPGIGVAIGMLIISVAILAGVIVWQLIGLMRSAADGTPFIAANVTRLRVIAGVMLVGAVAEIVAGWALPERFAELIEYDAPHFDPANFLTALMALVLAEVFRAGVALREDVEGTV